MDALFTQTDVAIIGGGLAGLSAACYLARAGVGVRLFEKAAELGGRAATQTYDGYQINRGIHALYTGGALEDGLNELGIQYSGHTPTRVFGLRGGKLYGLPVGVSSLIRSNLLDLGDKLELMRLFTAIPGLNPHDLRHESVQAWIDRSIRRPQVRQLFEALARTAVYCSALDLVSAELFVERTQIFFKHPVLYIDGGWQTLVDGLREEAEKAGARIVSSSRVEGVATQEGRAVGVRLRDGQIVGASAVIVATNPQDAVKIVGEDVSPKLRQAVDALIPAQIACLDVALRRLPDPRYPVVQDIDGARFMSAQSQFAQIAPDGGALIHLFKQLDPLHHSDPREDERDLEAMLDTVQPGWRDVLVKRVYLPRIDAIGALPTVNSGGFAGRPGVNAAGVNGLYLAGDWVGDEGFLADTSVASARQVARLLIHDLATLPAAQTVAV
jgi:phytoene dehydrogenase-like protein